MTLLAQNPHLQRHYSSKRELQVEKSLPNLNT